MDFRKILWLSAPTALLAAAYTVLAITVPIDRDSGVFIYSGQLLLAGGAPYLDAWDHKGPLLYLANALGLWLSDGHPRGVIILEGSFLALTVTWAVWAWSRLTTYNIAALIGIAFVLTFISVFELGNFSETWLTPFSLAAYTLSAIWLALRRGTAYQAFPPTWFVGLMVGAAGGVAATTRPNNGGGIFVIATVLALVADR